MQTIMVMKRIISLSLIIITLSGCTDQADTPSENIELFESPQPYPAYLTYVIPKPGTTVSLSSIDGWAYAYSPGLGDIQTEETICFAIKIAPLLRSGDSIAFFENFKLSLDGNEVKQEPDHSVLTEAVVGKDGGMGPLSDLICYDLRGEMKTGIRRFDLVVWTSTGEEFTYSWAIEVVR